MRLVATIIAAVMSVTTGGPLRCPCQLVPLLRPEAAVCETIRPIEGQTVERCCGCKGHREPNSEPTAPRPSPDRPPCQHGPAIDLVPPAHPGERVTDGTDPTDPATPCGGDPASVSPVLSLDTPLRVRLAPFTSLPDRLRYCHAFRC